MGSCRVIGTGANTLEVRGSTLEARGSVERQMRLRQFISQNLPDDISTDVFPLLLCPTDFVVECTAIIRDYAEGQNE